MKKGTIALIVSVMVLTLVSLSSAQIKKVIRPPLGPDVVKLYQFKKTVGINIPVLKRDVFLRKFGKNPRIPRTNQAVVDLARFLYSPAGRAQIREECGETVYGNLYAALQNPDISDSTRETVDSMAAYILPPFKTYSGSRFTFFYTDNNADSNHNVTLNEVKTLEGIMNANWDTLSADFTQPKGYEVQDMAGPTGEIRLGVKLYYLGSNLYGSTNSTWDYIQLCSKNVVKNPCNRLTTPGHELFHRVQYTYGYVSGTPDIKWATEGTAVWSQKHLASQVGDWLEWMDEGLDEPNKALITERSYDATHFWPYLGQQAKGEKETIKQVWSTFAQNGNNMKQAVETVIKDRINKNANFDCFAGWWMIANFLKDVSNNPVFDYAEDEETRKCNGTTYGPLKNVPREERPLTPGSSLSLTGSVKSYGAKYYVFTLTKLPIKVDISVKGASRNFGFAVAEIKNDQYQRYQHTVAGSLDTYSYTTNIWANQSNKIALMVMGNPAGGTYEVRVKASEAKLPTKQLPGQRLPPQKPSIPPQKLPGRDLPLRK